MWALSAAPAWPKSATTCFAWIWTRKRSASSMKAAYPSTSGPAGHGPQQRGGRPAALHDQRRSRRSTRHHSVHCRGTPPDEDGSADLKYVLAAARSIGRLMTDYKVVVDKSTVPVGTADLVREVIADELKKTRRGDSLQRGVQSRVPEGRCRRRTTSCARTVSWWVRTTTRPFT